MYNYARYRAYYATVLKNMEELYSGNKEILSVTGTSVTAKERYPTRLTTDMRPNHQP